MNIKYSCVLLQYFSNSVVGWCHFVNLSLSFRSCGIYFNLWLIDFWFWIFYNKINYLPKYLIQKKNSLWWIHQSICKKKNNFNRFAFSSSKKHQVKWKLYSHKKNKFISFSFSYSSQHFFLLKHCQSCNQIEIVMKRRIFRFITFLWEVFSFDR